MSNFLHIVLKRTSLAVFMASVVLVDVAYAGGASEKKTEGLPQFDPEYYASQAFWMCLTFGVLYLIFSRSILPSMSRTIERRHGQINGDLEEARNMKEQARAVFEAYEEALQEARVKAREMLAIAEGDIKAEHTKATEALRVKTLDQLSSLEASIEKTKAGAMKDMDGIAAEVAVHAVQSIVGIKSDIKKAKSVVAGLNKEAA